VPEHLVALSTASLAKDLGGIQEAAHKLAGMLAEFSTPVGELASGLEDRAAAGELDSATELISRLETAVAALLPLTEGLSLERLHTLMDQNPHSE